MLKSLCLAATLAAGAATAAPLGIVPTGDPLIASADAAADYDAGFDLLAIDAIGPTGAASAGAFPDLDALTIFGALGDPAAPALLDLFGTADPVAPILSGELLRVGESGAVLELLFRTLDDATGLFGPRLLVFVETGGPDPLGGFSLASTSVELTTPIPLPPSAWMLVAALAATALGARRRG